MPLNVSAIYPSSDPESTIFPSRRSVVHSTKGIVSCTQPLAAAAGQRILREGGNAADAAVAVAAALNVTEPATTGIGGDMFCLFYNAKTKKVHALNGSGRSTANASLDQIRHDLGLKPGESGQIPTKSAHAVTTPGAAAGWVDTVEKFGNGKLSLEQILSPAIELAEEGYPVSEFSSHMWRKNEELLREASPNSREWLKTDPKAIKHGNRVPMPGELFKTPTLAKTFRLLAKHGKKGFYQGEVAEALVKVLQDLGGHLDMEDLRSHMNCCSEEVPAISLRFFGQGAAKAQREALHGENSQSEDHHSVEIWEHPPNGQGIVALMALGILEELERTGKIRTFSPQEHNSADYLHALIESLNIAFADANWWIADPNVEKVPTAELISSRYLAERAKLFNPTQASGFIDHGSPAHNHNDTVYFAVTDGFGNGISFINSNYERFGSGIIPKGCGFVLQNRGANFVLTEGHPNVYAPNKRPYHTIIPAIVTNPSDQSLHSVYGVMGGFMQPQGHVQVLLNMLTFEHDPQTALDAPRICIGAGLPESGDVMDRTVYLEEGIREDVAEELRKRGHKVEFERGYQRWKDIPFGRAQIIRCHVEDGKTVYSAGSEPRGDGAAFPV